MTISHFLRSVFTVACFAFCTYFIISKNKSHEEAGIQGVFEKTNKVDDFSYSITMKDCVLNLEAKSAVLFNKKIIKLDRVNAVFKTNSNAVKISSQKCEINFEVNKVFLSEKVRIETDKENLFTEKAVIDLSEESIFSDVKVKGTRENSSFEADGFMFKKHSDISFKKVKIITSGV